LETELLVLLEKINNEFLMVAILTLIVSTYLIKSFIQVVWPFITKREKYKSARQLIKDDMALRETRQAEVDKRFEIIEAQLDILSESITQYDRLSLEQSRGIFENMVFNNGLDPYRRLKALRRLIALKGNGDAKREGVALALHNPNDWTNVLSLRMCFKCVDYKYYRNSIEEINRKIFDHGIVYEPNDENIELIKGGQNE